MIGRWATPVPAGGETERRLRTPGWIDKDKLERIKETRNSRSIVPVMSMSRALEIGESSSRDCVTYASFCV